MELSLLKSLPSKPGVYIFKNKNNNVIYVGKAKNIKKRVFSYFAKINLEVKTIKLLEKVEKVDHIVVGSELEAFLLEANLIKKYRPFFNIKMADDKYFPYIFVSNDNIPYVAVARQKEKKGTYFGPYADASALRIVLRLLRRLFPFQSIKNHPNRKCLYYHLGLCPCIKIFPENKKIYKKNLKMLSSFLNGKTKNVIDSLKKEQKSYIKKEEFEKAAQAQKKIEKIKLITQDYFSPFEYQERPELYKERLKMESKELKKILEKYFVDCSNLTKIECYDISNIQGALATGSMVVFLNGEPFKTAYRKFKISFNKKPNDYVMHQEMLKRRLKHKEWGLPDLMVIDGGKGQVSSALEVLNIQKVNTPIIGLAKKKETIIIPIHKFKNKYDFIEVLLPKDNPGVNLLRRIRDETHRFALSYHRLLRKKNMLKLN